MEGVRSIENGCAVPYSAAMVLLLFLTFLLRALCPDQPLVENYVGRQIPTAMVARNLDRGSGFLWPQLETAPFPNYFVVEPPIYELLVVGLKRLTSFELPHAGRLVSALFSAMAAWGLYWLVRHREGARLALLAVFIFSVFPLTIRYGRAFQPDASMLGTTVAGLACWDHALRAGSRSWRVAGWCLLAAGFAIKITSAFLLVPLLFIIFRHGRRRDLVAGFATLLPALVWYGWGNFLIGQGTGSHAAADNRSIWLAVLGPSALFNPATIKVVGWSLVVRAFTPLGAALALFGLWKSRGLDRADNGFWWAWAGATIAAMAFLASKLHHEYYWLPIAPVAAVGAARALESARRARPRVSTERGGGARVSVRVPDALHLANSGRVEQPDSSRPSRVGDRAARYLGGGARSTLVPGRPARLPDGMDERCGATCGRRVVRSAACANSPGTDRLLPPDGRPLLRRRGLSRSALAAKGLARRGPRTIQGDCGHPRRVDRRPLQFGDALECQLMPRASRFRTSRNGSRRNARSPS